MRMTLGGWTHHYYHRDTRLSHDPDFELPVPSSVSFVVPGQHKPVSYPRDSLIDAIDKRAGTYESETVERIRTQLEDTLVVLRKFDEVMYRMVWRMCLEGRVKLISGDSFRHDEEGYAEAARLYFDDDTDVAANWVDRSWDFLGLVLASPSLLERALAANAVWPKGLAWLRSEGYLE
jgi:hypothetical protein